MLKKEIMRRLLPLSSEERRYLEKKCDVDTARYMDCGENTVKNSKLMDRGKLITVTQHPRFVAFPEHTHDYIEMVYMCSGKTEHVINGASLTLSEGELLLLGQGAVQEILPAGENDIAINFIVLPEFFNTPMLMMGDEETPLRHFLIDCMKSKRKNASYMHFKVSDVLPVQNLLENLTWALLFNVPNRRMINQNTMGLLLLNLMNCTENLTVGSQRDEAVLDVLRYVEENYKNASLSDLAEEKHYDFAWYSRFIKRKTGSTFTELVQRKRLSQAVFCLKNTNMTIEDIAISVGYNNVSYFHRLFKQNFGQTPSEYKNANKDI